MRTRFFDFPMIPKISHLLCFVLGILATNHSYSQSTEFKAIHDSGCIEFKESGDDKIYLEFYYENDSLTMCLDSYTYISHFPQKLSKACQFAKTPHHWGIRDYNNKIKHARLRTIDSVSVANQFYASNCYIYPNPVFEDMGLLGCDFLNDFNWKIDFSNHLLYFDKEAFNIPDRAIENEFTINEFPWLSIQIGPLTHRFKVDLGAPGGLVIPANSELGKWIINKYSLSPNATKIAGSSGTKTDNVYQAHLDSIMIDGISIPNVDITISSNTTYSFLGCGLLKKGVLYLNYQNKETSNRTVGFVLKQ